MCVYIYIYIHINSTRVSLSMTRLHADTPNMQTQSVACHLNQAETGTCFKHTLSNDIHYRQQQDMHYNNGSSERAIHIYIYMYIYTSMCTIYATYIYIYIYVLCIYIYIHTPNMLIAILAIESFHS